MEIKTVEDGGWDSGAAYEQYVGRWSRQVAVEFLDSLDALRDLAWADVGCGTGALTAAILARHQPASIHALDASESFVDRARELIGDARVRFECGNAIQLPWGIDRFDACVSGLVLNFVPDPAAMVREMTRVTRRGGTVALYVWDYADGMEMLRLFWDAAATEDASAAALDEARRFPICQPEPLRELFTSAGLQSVAVAAIGVPTVFQTFDDYWRPFLGRTGPAPAYLASLQDDTVERIKQRLHARLTAEAGEPVALSARAWAVRGRVC
jgi:trans-aconitate methyltransferase